MGFGNRESGFGKAGGMKLTVNRRSVRALLLSIPESRFPIPGSARSHP
jgi:hypothetical protein